MFLKKIPPINIALFFIMIGIVVAAIVGAKKFMDSEDDLGNIYVESSYNKSLSQYYTDSLSGTKLSRFGKIEIAIYDPYKQRVKPAVICKIYSNGSVSLKKEAIALTEVLHFFPSATWDGEFYYRICEQYHCRLITIPLHSPHERTEREWTNTGH
jgi:hypothetical protein